MEDTKNFLNKIRKETEASERTSRDHSYYFDVFGYGEDGKQLNGKVILDVGSGSNDFAQVVNETGLAKVVALDPSYLSPSHIYAEGMVAGIAQMLPFKDEVFDEVIASYSLFWIDTGIDHALKEMLRITKKGGKVKIHPVDERPGVPLPNCVRIKALPVNIYGGNVLVITKDPNIPTHHFNMILREVKSYVDFHPWRIKE